MDPAVPSQELWCDMKIGGVTFSKSVWIHRDYDRLWLLLTIDYINYSQVINY